MYDQLNHILISDDQLPENIILAEHLRTGRGRWGGAGQPGRGGWGAGQCVPRGPWPAPPPWARADTVEGPPPPSSFLGCAAAAHAPSGLHLAPRPTSRRPSAPSRLGFRDSESRAWAVCSAASGPGRGLLAGQPAWRAALLKRCPRAPTAATATAAADAREDRGWRARSTTSAPCCGSSWSSCRTRPPTGWATCASSSSRWVSGALARGRSGWGAGPTGAPVSRPGGGLLIH